MKLLLNHSSKWSKLVAQQKSQSTHYCKKKGGKEGGKEGRKGRGNERGEKRRGKRREFGKAS